MTQSLRLALAQINLTVGDVPGNTARIIEYLDKARAEKANLVLMPELAITGYPPEDLVLRRDFVEANVQALKKVAEATQDLIAVVGCVERENGATFNTAAVCVDGCLLTTYHKIRLPNYGVFDEKRYFQPGYQPLILLLEDLRIGVTICEDIWVDGVVEYETLKGANLIVNLSASPYHCKKGRERELLFAQRARNNHVCLAYVNMVGGQDELLFDGQSFIFDAAGELLLRGQQFQEQLLVHDLAIEVSRATSAPRVVQEANLPGERTDFVTTRSFVLREARIDLPARPVPLHVSAPNLAPHFDEEEEVFQALVLGTRDYMRKNGFQKVVIGLSGGIDSALTAVIAVAAIGSENVTGVLMPSRFTISASIEDAHELAQNLDIRTYTIPIHEAVTVMENLLVPLFAGRERDITEENIQARIRGMILMALSNKFGWLVLTTSNKSEVAVGYATLYGDMAGGFSVLKDVPKTFVYRLSRWVNQVRFAGRHVIPWRVISRPPSAELRPNQTDQDTLPPYDLLDQIVEAYMEDDRSVAEMVAAGLPEDVVRQVVKMIDRAEYKRRQAAPGIKITPRNFGKDRRMPITNQFQP
ncbi:MAG: NAD+ synthase [candidate division KSB1 bacterium]|nr:NAD+ synthase [candidate division KSB1 bacterium]